MHLTSGVRRIHRRAPLPYMFGIQPKGSDAIMNEISLTVGGSRMAVLVAMPAGAGPHPAVVLMHHRSGLDEFTRRSAERLAASGFLTAAPNVYHRRPAGEDTALSRKAMNDGELTADIDATVAYLLTREDVRADAIAIMGHCAGGRMSYLGAASNPRFKAAVVLYGGGILRGEGDGRPAPLDLTKDIRGPVLGLFGKDDTNPSPADVERIAAELTRHKIRHEFQSFDGAGHAFQNFEDPNRYRKNQAEAAWTRLLGFLKKELRA
jgi:carboxymethylenebutenolidase